MQHSDFQVYGMALLYKRGGFLNSQAISNISSSSLGGTQNLDHLSTTQAIVTSNRVTHQNTRKKHILEATNELDNNRAISRLLSLQQSLLFLFSEDNVLRNKDMFSDIDDQLGL